MKFNKNRIRLFSPIKKNKKETEGNKRSKDPQKSTWKFNESECEWVECMCVCVCSKVKELRNKQTNKPQNGANKKEFKTLAHWSLL